jgi:hypothetical protein
MENKEKYEEEVKCMSVDELKEILINRNLYNGWLITSARKELEFRNISLSKDENDRIQIIKKAMIDEAKESMNCKLDIENPWFKYIDYKISTIQMDFIFKSYISRVFKIAFYSFIFCLIVFGAIISIAQHKLGYQEITNSFILAIGLTFIVSLSSLVQERFYILSLKANNKSIEIQYLHFNNKLDFQSDINCLEIIKKKTFERFPKPILIVKKEGRLIVKFYSLVNDGLTEEKMDLLIENLKKLKANQASFYSVKNATFVKE